MVPPSDNLEQSYNGGLFKEYQKQKQRLQETIQQKERERDELVRQLAAPLQPVQVADNRLQGDGWVIILVLDFIQKIFLIFTKNRKNSS